MTTNNLNYNPIVRGNRKAQILVVCEPQRQDTRSPMNEKSMSLFVDTAAKAGIDMDDVLFVQHVPPIPEEIANSDSRKKKWAEPYSDVVLKIISIVKPKIVVTLGDLATKQITKSTTKFTSVRGTLIDGELKVFPITSPAQALTRPEALPIFSSDVINLASVIRGNFSSIIRAYKTYTYQEDISYLLDNPPELISIDTETTGLEWEEEYVRVLTVQISWEKNQAIVLPVDPVFWDWSGREEQRQKLIQEIKTLLENPKVKKVGHNITFDLLMLKKLGIEVKGVYADTELWAWGVDENLLQKNIDNLCKVFLPEMSGYNDCVLPDTDITLWDLTTKKARDIVSGDELLGFSEYPELGNSGKLRRFYKKSIVESNITKTRNCTKVILENGSVLEGSENHRVLVKRSYYGGKLSWTYLKDLKEGDLIKVFPNFKQSDTFDSGWLSGLLDGEGFICSRGRNGLRSGFSQKHGQVLSKAINILDSYGLDYYFNSNKKVPDVTFTSSNETIKLLQITRPVRLLNNLDLEGKNLCVKESKVVRVEPLGEGEVCSIQTSSRTYISNGILSHNCYNRQIDKSDMVNVPKDIFLQYAGGDSDACLQLFHVLDERLKKEPSQRRLLFKVKMPALMLLMDMSEAGVKIDTHYLRSLVPVIEKELQDKYDTLIRLVPDSVIRKHYNPKKKNNNLSFSRDRFIIDIMFSKEGFNLKPVVFTKSTKLLSEEERVPSASAKDHFPFFLNEKGDVGKFVSTFMEYTKLEKLLSTYIAPFEQKYVCSKGTVHSKFSLARTVTGRIASSDPNLTNLPARGPYAKKYKKIFIPHKGRVFVSADSSQAELRLIAHRAQDPVMLSLYREDIDIHTYTAKKVLDISDAQWDRLTPEEKKLNRFKAKAVNFGLCIAEGQKVLTHLGLVPIEDVTTGHLLWDGVEWVSHEGVIYKGYKEVIEYDGLVATPEHKVYTKNGKISFREAASEVQGGGILQTGIGETPIRIPVDYSGPDILSERLLVRNVSVPTYTDKISCIGKQPISWEDYCEQVQTKKIYRGAEKSISQTTRLLQQYITKTHRRVLSYLQKLWRKRTCSRFYFSGGLQSLYAGEILSRGDTESSSRQNRQQQRVRKGKHKTGISERESHEHSKKCLHRLQKSKSSKLSFVASIKDRLPKIKFIRNSLPEISKSWHDSRGNIRSGKKKFAHVFDIVNAGPRNRFTVSNKLVSNCYGMGASKFQLYAKTDYGLDLTKNEAVAIREQFFRTYPRLYNWHQEEINFVKRHGYVITIDGQVRHLPSIFSEDKMVRASTERQAINSVIQGPSSNLALDSLVRIRRQQRPEITPLLFIHDDNVMEVDEHFAWEAANAIVWTMRNHRLYSLTGERLTVGMKGEPDIGYSLGEMYELMDLSKDAPQWIKDLPPIDPLKPVKPSWWNDERDK